MNTVNISNQRVILFQTEFLEKNTSSPTSPNNDSQHRVKSSTLSSSSATPAEHQELEIERLILGDVKSLWKTDSFMYYSIPCIHRSAMSLEDINHSNKECSLPWPTKSMVSVILFASRVQEKRRKIYITVQYQHYK